MRTQSIEIERPEPVTAREHVADRRRVDRWGYRSDRTPLKIASGVHGDAKSGCPVAAVACTASRIAQYTAIPCMNGGSPTALER